MSHPRFLMWALAASLIVVFTAAAGAQGTVASDAEASAPRFFVAESSRDAGLVPLDVRRVPALMRRISLNLDGVPLKEALADISMRSGLTLVYGDGVLPPGKRVSLRAELITVVAALTDLLADTGVDVLFNPRGGAALVRRASAAQQRPDTVYGAITGRVVDSTTAHPLPGQVVTVDVDGGALRAVTNEEGAYVLLRVPAGVRMVRVRRLGYMPASQEVVVTAGQPVRAEFALRLAMSRLEEVVMTATGARRRLELGNAITTINVDSLVRTQPIANLTDLLEARVPGLVVTHTSGAPGDPARLRLRGFSSVTRSNDPIVIVDGIRIYAAQSASRSANLASLHPSDGQPLTETQQVAAPSPLDQLDPQSIERIEVFKGPSAATMYGADAANGVIVVTTKQGRAGPPRWTVSANYGPSFMPGNYPDAYFRWGRQLATGELAFCALADYGCAVDSLVRFQALNDRDLTVLGRGHRESVSLGVSGGTAALTYALTGSFSDETGMLKLPDREVRRLLAVGADVPVWMRRPHHLSGWHGTGRVGIRLGRNTDVSFASTLSQTKQRRSSLDQRIAEMMGVYADTLHDRYYSGSMIIPGRAAVPRARLLTDAYARTTAEATTFTDALHVNWRPLRWLTATADLGLNVISRSDEMMQLPRAPNDLLRDGDLPEFWDFSGLGLFNTGTGRSIVTTVNSGVITVIPLGAGRLRTAFGGNFTRTRTSDLLASGIDLVPGATGLGGARQIRTTEQRVGVTTFGWYVEPTLESRRFYLSTGLRLDGSDTYGLQRSLAGFPKVSLSYLLSEEAFFPFKPIFDVFRLRAAYGQAGVQPSPGDRLRLYTSDPRWLDGGTVDARRLSTVGNDFLKPERSEEFEGGLDADLFGRALTIELTTYRKTRVDAIIPFTLPPSVNAGGTVLVNVGKVRNSGFEIGLGTNLVRSDLVTIGTQMHVSRNRNVVLSLGDVGPINSTNGTRVVAGYPLFGRWARPIVHYADADGDGIIARGEVQIGDEEVFLGPIEPNYEAALHANLSLYRGRITASAGFSYIDGQLQVNAGRDVNKFIVRGANDPTAPLGEQAAIVALDETSYGLAQELSTFRFNSLAVAFNAPPSLAHRWFGARTASLSLQGTNLGLSSNYRGKDPAVNAFSTGNAVVDTGQLPLPRTWAVGIRLDY